MHLAAVKLFLEVAEAGSLSKVAARRQTVQSHISRQITEFEASCGGRLFKRTGRGVALTDLGQLAAQRLRLWVQDTEQLALDLRADAGELRGEVRIGVIPTAAHPLMTRVYQQLQPHPGIRLNLVEAQGAELDSLLDAGLVDLAILFRIQRQATAGPKAYPDETLLSRAGTYLISAPDDPLTASPTLQFAQLRGLRLVLPRRPSHWRETLDDTARSQGFTLDAAVEADSLTIQKELPTQIPGLYAILGPYTVMPDLHAGRLRASRLIDPDLQRNVTLAMPKHGKLTPAVRVVAKTIEQTVQSWQGRLMPVQAGRPASAIQ